MNKRVITIATAIIITLFVLVVFWQARGIVVYLLFSLFLGATLRPIAELAPGKSKTFRVLVYIVAGLVLLAILYLIYRLLGLLGIELASMTQNFATMENWRMPLWLARLAWVRTLLGLLPTPGQLFEAGIGDNGQTLLPALQATTQSITALLSGALIVTFMSLYLMVSIDHFERLWLSLLPSGVRQKVRAVWRRIIDSLGDYGRFLAGQLLLTWVVISIGSYFLGSPFPVLVGLLVAITSLVPVIGIPLALVIKFFIGLLGGYTFTPWIMIYVAVVLVLMRLFVWPRMYKRNWDSPMLSLVIALAFAQTVGLRWTLLAPPLAAIINILWTHLVARGKRQEEINHFTIIKQRREELEACIAEIEGDLPPALSSSLGKLDDLLAKAAPILEE